MFDFRLISLETRSVQRQSCHEFSLKKKKLLFTVSNSAAEFSITKSLQCLTKFNFLSETLCEIAASTVGKIALTGISLFFFSLSLPV